jgi:glucosamine 6-phosphate synthetase-like amidotransferase/phosphosugar isomerase protein
MIEKEDVDEIRDKLNTHGFNIKSETDITENVAKGLELDTTRRELQIHEKVPGMLKKHFKAFAGTKGTKRFDSFNNGKFEYRSFLITKN